MNTYDVEHANRFLKSRIVDEAMRQGVSLTEAEVALLTYSEVSASDEERAHADEVDAEIGSDKYEAKVTKLIRRAYSRDLAEGRREEWDACVRALRDEDLYVLVMMSSAGVKGLRGSERIEDEWYSSFLRLDFLCLAALGCAGCLFFFTPLGRVLKSDAWRATLFLAWLAALWLVGEWSKRRLV